MRMGKNPTTFGKKQHQTHRVRRPRGRGRRRAEDGIDCDCLLPVRDNGRDDLRDLARFNVHQREEDVVHTFFTCISCDGLTQCLRVVLVATL